MVSSAPARSSAAAWWPGRWPRRGCCGPGARSRSGEAGGRRRTGGRPPADRRRSSATTGRPSALLISPRGVRLALADDDQTELVAGGRGQPRVVGDHRQVDPGAHHRAEARAEHQGGERAALDQRRRQAGGTDPAGVDDHVEVDVAQPVEGVGQVLPDRAEVGGAAGLGEAGQEQPAVAVLAGERQALVDDHLAQRPAVPVGLGDAEQALAVAGLAGQVAGQDGLVRAGIAVGQQDRARPGQGEADGQGGDAG